MLPAVGWLVFVFQIERAALRESLMSKAEKISRDRYLGMMMQDPLYTWRPEGDLTRAEIVSPGSYSRWARGTGVSRISVRFVCRTAGDASSLMQRAQQVSSDAGYVDGRRVDHSGLGIQSRMHINGAGNGIVLLLWAPG